MFGMFEKENGWSGIIGLGEKHAKGIAMLLPLSISLSLEQNK
jgi:hypothetical protein